MKTSVLLPLACAGLVFAAQAGTIAVDPTNGINGLVSGFGGLTLGWEFEVTDTNGITVDGLAFWDYQSDGFLFGQTFPVGLWDASTGTLLVETVVTSASPMLRSLDPDGAWRVNSILPLILPPGLYRVGALNQRIEPTTSSVFRSVLQSKVSDALLVTTHPRRSAE